MDKIIHLEARLKCDPSRAYAMFTENARLESWLAAKADVEPHVGGKYELFWQPDTPEDNSTLGCKVTAVAQGALIAFEWRGPVQFKPFMNHADPLTHVVVSFATCADGGTPCTDVHLIHTGWRNSPEWEAAREYFVKAWGSALESLKQCINNPS